MKIFGEHDEATLKQITVCGTDHDGSGLVAGATLCADGHKGYSMPIGGVVAYRNAVSPSGVGYDIACGNKAVRLDVPADEVRKNIAALMDDIWKTLSFGVGRRNDETVEHPLFESDSWKVWPEAFRDLKQKARVQLGTIGSGNHYVDLFIDESDEVWIGVHFGSRGFGHGVATLALQRAGAKDGMDALPTVIPLDTDLGKEYWELMELAGKYAYAGRDWVCSRVASILGAKVVEEVHNHHNFAWKETHGGEELVVVRKGATPAFPGQKGFVGGSMGDVSVILEGVKSQESEEALYSTVHGAGRVMSRTRAAGKMNYKTRERTGGEVSREDMLAWIQPMGVELRGAGTDESPQAYKRLPEVLAYHADTVRILHTLTPIGVAMAGADEYDPYKD